MAVPAALTREVVFGMNIVTLAGFAVMAMALNIGRAGRSRAALSISLMGAGTVLVFAGLYLASTGA